MRKIPDSEIVTLNSLSELQLSIKDKLFDGVCKVEVRAKRKTFNAAYEFKMDTEDAIELIDALNKYKKYQYQTDVTVEEFLVWALKNDEEFLVKVTSPTGEFTLGYAVSLSNHYFEALADGSGFYVEGFGKGFNEAVLDLISKIQGKRMYDTTLSNFITIPEFGVSDLKEHKSLIPSSLNGLSKAIHKTAKEKGWWEKERNPLELHMLMVSEIAEASEEVRNKKPAAYYNLEGPVKGDVIEVPIINSGGSQPEGYKPEGEAIELADCIIRILDYAGAKEWDMDFYVKEKMKYNETRSYRHGGKAA
jgi:NTP pyrophosphatase (non-canonical NTP hydrolase)